MIVSSLYAPDGNVDTLSAFLLIQCESQRMGGNTEVNARALLLQTSLCLSLPRKCYMFNMAYAVLKHH